MSEETKDNSLKINFLGREAKISDSGRAIPIEEIRRSVVKNPKNISIGIADGQRRVGLYRNTYRLETVVIENSESFTDEQIREFVKAKILDGAFDRLLTTVYAQLRKGLKVQDE